MVEPLTHIPENILSELYSYQLIEQLPVAIYSCDVNGNITHFNNAATLIWGRQPEKGKDKWCGSVKMYDIASAELAHSDCPMAVTVQTGKPDTGREIIIERPDGSRVYTLPHPKPLFDKDGNISGAISMIVDITDRKKAEQAILGLAAIVQSSDDAVISKNLNGVITSWNDSAERIFGYTAEETIGRSVTLLIPKDRLEEEPKILERLKRGERVDHFETKRLTKDGHLIDISLTISPVKDHNGIIIGASKIARDITDNKKTERIIIEGEERFKMAIAATGLGTWEYDPVNGKLNWSEECRKLYNIPEDLTIDFTLFANQIYPADRAFAEKAIGEAMNAGSDGNYDIQFRIVRYGTGEIRWIRSQGKVYFDLKGQPERFIGTVLDITEDRISKDKLEQIVKEKTDQLSKANKELEKSNSELEQFAYVASHDLQEPLRKIQTFASRLQMKGDAMLNEELNNYIARIIQSSDKMSLLIKNLLNYARISRGDVQFVKTDLNEVLHSVIDDLQINIFDKRATIEAADLPVIESLPLQMGQLFYNLLNNALKFSNNDVLPVIQISCDTLSAERIKELNLLPDMTYYQLGVKDNGIGFNSEYSKRIFEIFQRLNNKDDYPGTGIGLALCKKVTDNHNGLIFARGNENEGAVFTVILPEKQVI